MTEHPWSYHGCFLGLSSRPRETAQPFRLKDRLTLLAMGQWWFRPARPAVGEQASQTSSCPRGTGWGRREAPHPHPDGPAAERTASLGGPSGGRALRGRSRDVQSTPTKAGSRTGLMGGQAPGRGGMQGEAGMAMGRPSCVARSSCRQQCDGAPAQCAHCCSTSLSRCRASPSCPADCPPAGRGDGGH